MILLMFSYQIKKVPSKKLRATSNEERYFVCGICKQISIDSKSVNIVPLKRYVQTIGAVQQLNKIKIERENKIDYRLPNLELMCTLEKMKNQLIQRLRCQPQQTFIQNNYSCSQDRQQMIPCGMCQPFLPINY